jgi:hypothetical protein
MCRGAPFARDEVMHLVQILLPTRDGQGNRLDQAGFEEVRDELTQQFGGVTAYSRSPAEGLWKDDSRHTTRDDVILVEVMVDTLDRGWWNSYRRTLEARFHQDQVIIRASEIETL